MSELILCTCKSVSAAQIEEAVATGARGFGDLSLRLGVGVDCGHCVEGVNAVLQRCLTAARTASASSQSVTSPLPDLSTTAPVPAPVPSTTSPLPPPAKPAQETEPSHAWFAVDL